MASLSADKRVEIIAHLVECNSVRGTARLCHVDTKTVMGLLLRVGEGCRRLHDRLVRGLAIHRVGRRRPTGMALARCCSWHGDGRRRATDRASSRATEKSSPAMTIPVAHYGNDGYSLYMTTTREAERPEPATCILCDREADSEERGLCREHARLVVDVTAEKPITEAGRRAGWK